jgi:hypothetical protein
MMHEFFNGYSFECIMNFGHLIAVKGGDSGGKSVSTESVRP